MDPRESLSLAIKRFTEATDFTPVIGGELEFYVPTIKDALPEAFIKDCYQQFGSNGVLTHAFESEGFPGQFEINTLHQPDALAAADALEKVKQIIIETGKNHRLAPTFSAKPFPKQPGCGMHIHISLYDKNNHNVFSKPTPLEDPESPLLMHSIAGLLETMAESMLYFAPKEEDYARFVPEFYENEEQCFSYAPATISWGGNNRTTALRVPTSTVDPAQRHIEHRVPCADANPHAVIAAILAGIAHGIANTLMPPEKIWGNAFEAQYELPKLPQNLEEAQTSMNKGTILGSFLESLCQ